MADIATRNRQEKAMAIVGAIDDQFQRQFPQLCPFDQSGRLLLVSHEWTDAHWLKLAQQAGYRSKKTPGPTTRGMVREILKGRATAPLARQAS